MFNVRCSPFPVFCLPLFCLLPKQAVACDYVLKGGGFRKLVSVLHDLQAGGAPMSPGIARQVLQ